MLIRDEKDNEKKQNFATFQLPECRFKAMVPYFRGTLCIMYWPVLCNLDLLNIALRQLKMFKISKFAKHILHSILFHQHIVSAIKL